jgi:hypothetical protein
LTNPTPTIERSPDARGESCLGTRKGGRKTTKADRVRAATLQKLAPNPGQLTIADPPTRIKEAPDLHIPATDAVSVPAEPRPTVRPLAPAGLSNRETGFFPKWKTFWAFVGPMITVLGLANYYWPSLTITTGVNLGPEELFQTQFLVTNSGHNYLYDITFICDLIGYSATIHELDYDSRNLQPIPVLVPNHPVSRGCFAKSLVENGPWLKVTVEYRWPLIGWHASEIAFFSAKRGANSFYLVPEAAPTAEPPAMFEMNSPSMPTGAAPSKP